MNEDEIELLKSVKEMLTGGLWKNKTSHAPVIDREDQRRYGEIVELKKGEDLVESWGAASRAWSESGQTVWSYHEIDLGDDVFCVYILDRFLTTFKKETIEKMVLSWAKQFHEDKLKDVFYDEKGR